MQSINRTTISLIGVALIILIGGTSAKLTPFKADFNGTWVINKEKSDFGTLTAEKGAPEQIKIIQKTDSLIFKRVFTGKPATIETLSNDGTVLNTLTDSTNKFTHLQWAEDGQTLSILSNYKVNNKGFKWEYNRTETWKLSNNGKTLIVDRVTVIPDRTEIVKAVYNKN